MLNIAAHAERSVVNGPGERYVLWLQGCPRRCAECCNADFLPDEPRQVLPVETVAASILSTPGIAGVTYTGGEPFMQDAGLAALTARLRADGLSIVCYTGYTLEELQASDDTAVQELLGGIDLLIDGPYLREQAASLRWRGSRNQRVHFLSERYRHLAGEVAAAGEIELTVGEGSVTASGAWPPGFIERVMEVLRH